MAQQRHTIFDDIERGDLQAVQQRVLANGAVLEEWKTSCYRRTPLIHAVYHRKPAIALWLIAHRGQHNVNTRANTGWTALHWASACGPLAVVQTLVAAGANPAAHNREGWTPLIAASACGHIETVAFLLQLPPIRASIDHIDQYRYTALSTASYHGYQSTVQLLLDADAEPTLPPGQHSPLNRAFNKNRHATAALLRHTIAEADRARALHKARSLLGADAASLACLQGLVKQGEAMPQIELTQQQQQGDGNERLRATMAFALGVSGGENDTGLCEELFVKLLGHRLPVWSDRGPAEV